ncbi:MAG: class I SAM-dependent methyltransferase [Bacteroidota bacterium]
MEQDFNTISYEKHKNHNKKFFNKQKLATWKDKKTIDYWRHERMYCNLIPFISSNKDQNWLTVGDGRYGTDANYLITNGAKNVVASDISETYLKIALEEGFISQYKIENAESMTFENNSFDYVLCKESYHHFPRPMTALYEMIRVAKKAVILIEPQDFNIINSAKLSIIGSIKLLVQTIKNEIKKNLGKKIYYDFGNYEDVGNYVFTISEREIEKVALGLNFDMISFKTISDYYVEGVEDKDTSESSVLFQEVKKNIKKLDNKAKSDYSISGVLIAIIHKNLPDEEILKNLKTIGFSNHTLPKNPYC